MAVKQNNTEANANASPTNASSNSNGAVSNVSSTTVGGSTGEMNGVKAKMNVNIDEIDGSSINDGSSNPEQCGVGLGSKSNNVNVGNQDNDDFSDGGLSAKKAPNDIAQILHIIKLVEHKQQEMGLSFDIVLPIYEHLLVSLSRIQFPRSPPEDRQRFKDAITRIGEFFAKPNDKKLYLYYLRVIWQLITESQETPSCSLAIIFGFFDSDMIIDAVQMLLEHKISDASIRHSVRLLCNWLSICTFCQNIHLWIVAILGVLKEQQKMALLEEIAYDNVDGAFANLIVPLLRPKVMPLCFFFLSTISRTPRVFHKIVPRIPKVFKFLKQQSDAWDDAKQTMQKMARLISALMLHFGGYDEFYQPVEDILRELQLFDEKAGNEDLQHLAQLQNNAKAGLVNLGNTCYMNSVLQALANTQEFSRDILLCKSSSPLIIRMQEQIALMLYSYRDELTPARVLNVARPPSFIAGLQQDSSEFLSYLLETLHVQETNFRIGNGTAIETASSNPTKAFAKLKSIESRRQSDINADDIHDDPKEESNNKLNVAGATGAAAAALLNRDNTVSNTKPKTELTVATLSTIEKTFTGKQATTYRCLTCGFKSLNIDIFRDLQLSFPELKNDCASNYSVQDLLDFYCSPEKLDGDNQYFCERCQRLTDGERSVRVISAPKNLIITLKHFKYDHKFHTRAKLMHKVFHDEKVYVKICATESLEEIASAHYDLYASVVHSGYSMDSGHYYTYAADASNRWYKFNDNIVTPSKAEELHNLSQPNTPYILFYQMAARSNESTENSSLIVESSAACTTNIQIVKVEMPLPLKLDELPCSLREYVNRDNNAYNEELKVRRLKNTKASNVYGSDGSVTGRTIRRNDRSDDEDDSPPTGGNGVGGGGGGGCGGNALSFNVNRFVC